MKSELEKLIELQKTDTNIRKLKKAIETAEERRASIGREFEQHASSIREIQQKREAANKTSASSTARIGVIYIAECRPSARNGSSAACAESLTPAAVAACLVKKSLKSPVT